MFWRFGFHNGSSIDGLLDKEDVSLEAILDEDDLLQECKAQNTRLIDYFQRVDVLQRLLGYVTGQIEVEEPGKFKYPYVATEVLCSEIWSIVETCINHADQLLTPFWETVLDRSPEDMKTQIVMASHFVKINAVFLNKKPAEMFQFIFSQPSVVERILQHIETPPFSDLLVRIIQLDEQPAGAGVLEWLSNEHLMARLIDRLSPSHFPDMHTVVSELIKAIISMAAPSPSAAATENQQNAVASNLFARELAQRTNVQKLVDYILYDFGPELPSEISEDASIDQVSTNDAEPSGGKSTAPCLPNLESAVSSVVQSICIIIELIRQNNSDFYEPYLFHTLRIRLIQTQQTLQNQEEGRQVLEHTMKEMVDRMGVVHLRPLLEIFCNRLEELDRFLRKPRSENGPIATTIGKIAPLTFERYRICELYAEVLHCSGMSLLNRSPDYDGLYDSFGHLQGGLSALEDLAQVIAMGNGNNSNQEAMDEGGDELEPALEFPVHGASHDISSLLDSDEDMSDGDGPGSSDDDAMEEITMYDEPKSIEGGSGSSSPTHVRQPTKQASIAVPSSPSATEQSSDSPAASPRRRASSQSSDSDGSTMGHRSVGSRRSSRRLTVQDVSQHDIPLPIGERLKQRLLDLDVLSTLLDLFFEFPWNNFLHTVVHDFVNQVVNGRVDGGVNRALILSLFRDAKIMQRIVEGQRRNDAESAKPKGARLGYMGQLTLMAEEVITALEHYPPDIRLDIAQSTPQPDWDEYVTGRYKETKKNNTSLLGGGKPAVSATARPGAGQWKIDESETITPATGASVASGSGTGDIDPNVEDVRGEFRRATNAMPTRGNTADFGPAPLEDEDDDDDFTPAGHPHFAQYLAQEMHSSDEFGSSSSPDHSDDEDGGWLSQSHFELERPPPVSVRPPQRERRPLSANGFDDPFVPRDISMSPFGDPFTAEDEDEDAFGPFSDSAAASGSDPFSFSSSFTEDIQDAAFDSFGEFGEFHSTDGETTPTAGSWTFASGSSVGSIEDSGSGSEDAGRAGDSEQPKDGGSDGEGNHPLTAL